MKMLCRFFTRLWNMVSAVEFIFARVMVRYSFLQRYSSFLTDKETSWLEAVESDIIAVVVAEFASGELEKINHGWHQDESSFVFSRQHCPSVKSPTSPGIRNTSGTL